MSEIDELKAEIDRLKDKCDKQAMILRRLNPEKYPDTIFITGIGGTLDANGMPSKLYVCRAYGVDWSYEYEWTGETPGPEW